MAGFSPAIHDLRRNAIILKQVVDGRHKACHDNVEGTRFGMAGQNNLTSSPQQIPKMSAAGFLRQLRHNPD